MISRFTHPDFEIDFEGKGLNIVEENHWFSDQFFSKYSFPFDFDVNEELDVALGMITQMNAVFGAKKFDGFFQHFGQEYEAVLVIERIKGKKASGKLRYGFEEFPNFDTKLSELALEQKVLTEELPLHAQGIISQTWPNVNYNFPQVFAEKFDTDNIQWQYFEGIMNNYRSGAFVLNEYDAVNDEQVNRNIVQPLPYLLHVVQQGFADKGLELTGDILEDPEFKEACITMISDYYTTSSQDDLVFSQKASDYDEIKSVDRWYGIGRQDVGVYLEAFFLPGPGRYKVAGNVILRSFSQPSWADLKLNGNSTFWTEETISVGYREKFLNVDETIEVPVGENGWITFESQQLYYAIIDGKQDSDVSVLDLTITKIAEFDENGELVPQLIAPQEINLQRCVPDMTFGDLMKVIKNWKNYDLDIQPGKAVVNLISNQIKSNENIIDLSMYEVEDPQREFFQDKSFLLKFQEVNSDEYDFAEIFVDDGGARSSSFVKDENTSEIIINAIPLPLIQKGAINTADYFLENEGTLALVLYAGITGNLNLCKDSSKLLIPAVYDGDWKEWINFRINAEGLEWEFLCDEEMAARIRKNSKVHAYGKYYFVKRLGKGEISPGWWEVSFEGEGRH